MNEPLATVAVLASPPREHARHHTAAGGLLRALAHSRLAQFLVVGGAIFALSRRPTRADDTIRIESRTIAALQAEEARRLGAAALTPEQAAAVRARVITDEILVREARRLGLDTEDRLVRERLVQKVLFLAEDLGGASREPTTDELTAFFEASRDRYTRPARARFVHVFASSREAAAALAPAVAAWEREPHAPSSPPPLGEPLPVSRFVDASEVEIAAVYGPAWFGALEGVDAGAWSAPIRSRLGWHLVKVLEKSRARPATFDEARAQLPLDWLIARREAAVSRYLDDAFRRQQVELDGVRLAAPPVVHRTAAHARASVED